jgi:hypothetical protein
MAATKQKKTPAKASKKSKVENRRIAPTIGDTAAAEFDPARTTEGERVAQTGANPSASRAGILVEIPVPGAADDDEALSFSVIDGSSATLSVGGKAGRPRSQAELITLRKTLDQVIQGTS